MKLKTAIIGSMILLALVFIATLKICSVMDVGINGEKNGYCRINYGEQYKYSPLKDECYNPYNYNGERYDINFEEFRKQCPKNKWLSPRVLTKCFLEGDNF